MDTQQEKFESWAIVELMGHRKLAGKVTEQVIAGSALLRIDIPGVTQNGAALAGYTQFYGASSIYCLTPTTEEIARRYTLFHREQPIQAYELPQLPQPNLSEAAPAESPDPEDAALSVACSRGDHGSCTWPNCSCACHD